MLTDSSVQTAHVGYAIGRNVGGAVQRNRIRRQLRSLLDSRAKQLPAGWYLIGVQPRIASLSWNEIGEAVDHLLGKVAA